jgi:hypothetical protein
MINPNPPVSPRYIWQYSAWPQLTFDAAALASALELARLGQGRLLGLLGAIELITTRLTTRSTCAVLRPSQHRLMQHLGCSGLIRRRSAISTHAKATCWSAYWKPGLCAQVAVFWVA